MILWCVNARGLLLSSERHFLRPAEVFLLLFPVYTFGCTRVMPVTCEEYSAGAGELGAGSRTFSDKMSRGHKCSPTGGSALRARL